MLEIVVFVCGAVLMILEIVGSRVLAPFLGTSIVIWTSLIGVIMACLSLGYWLGGRLVDKKPSLALLSRTILGAGMSIITLALLKTPILEGVQAGIANLYLASVMAAMLLFGIPSLLLGMVTPVAVRLRLDGMEHSGQIVGRMYAISTVGSIVGTFLAGFVLLSTLGVTSILYSLAAILGLLGAAISRSKASLGLVLALCAGLLLLLDRNLDATTTPVVVETSYNHIIIREGVEGGSGRRLRVLSTDPGKYQAAMYLDDPTALALDYTRHYLLLRHVVPPAQRLLLVGGGGYSVPKYLLAHFPDITMDVCEIDPGMTAVAQRYFGLMADPRLTIHHQDGRVFLNRLGPGSYDAILIDAFNSAYAIPFHMATAEAFTRVKAALRPGGVCLVNVLSAREGPNNGMLRAVTSTLASVFGGVEVFAVSPATSPESTQNFMLLATAGPRDSSFGVESKGKPDLERVRLLATRHEQQEPGLVLRDDFAPVDSFLVGMLLAERRQK